MSTSANAGANLLIRASALNGPAGVDIRITDGKFSEIGAGLTS